ncbi:histidine phosphatase family protein [Paenibacillus tundrae]|uniref:Phosphoglycerate mutase n=1 Tax=Paenibacillus tundrae TaxID=528187 RepID=A0ABT9W9Z8_9BACL|nr:histidine phosphatase family protein [Paenibacillus tundrae]MDQ0170095.1 putative phosphoglycerate mutase [Paenibacillus tundrae]
MTIFGLIRHGVTDWNYEYRAQGHTDIPLNAEGRRQAELLARRMENEEWDVIYSSDLSRALETAEMVGKLKNIEVRTDLRLREMNGGLTEGTTEQERVNQWGYSWSKLDLGIEPQADIIKRGVDCLADLAERHPNQKLLIVSHGAILGLILRKLIRHVDMQESLHNTSVTIINKEQVRWNCERYNCISHLDGA